MTAVRHTGDGGDVQRVLDDLAAELGRSVVVDDPGVHLLYATRHYGDEDPVRVRAVLQRDAGAEVAEYVLGQGVSSWEGPGTLPASEALGLRARWCVPLRHSGVLLGLLMVINDRDDLTEAQRARIVTVGHWLATALAARLDGDDPATLERRAALLSVLSADAAEHRAGLRRLHAAGVPELPFAALRVLEVAPGPAEQTIAVALRSVIGRYEASHRTPCVAALGPGRVTVLQLFRARPSGAELAGTGRALLDASVRALGRSDRPPVHVGTGSVVGTLAAARRSAREAELAVRAARLLPRLGSVASWEQAMPYGPLLHLPDAALTAELVPEPLRNLLRHDAAPRLRRTLETYLDHACSIPRTAAALHLHRTSLYYRLRQISELTGLDLDDGDHRLVLHQGLKALELLDAR